MTNFSVTSNAEIRTRPPRKPRKRGSLTEGLFGTSRPGGLHERVYRSLTHAITSGRFERGAQLPSEPELCVAFAVSRPVVRQALERLRSDGLVESRRGSGNYVCGVDRAASESLSASERLEQTRRMMDDLEFRLLIEPEAAFLAARRRGPADVERMEAALRKFEDAHASGAITHHFDFLFHEAIALATTNAHFVEAVRSLEYRPDDARIPMRDLVHFRPLTLGVAVLSEHEKIFDLIQKRDAERARSAMLSHLDAARARVVRYVAIPSDSRAFQDAG